MKKTHIILITVTVLILAIVAILFYEKSHGSFRDDENSTSTIIRGGDETMTYKQIKIEEAKQIFESEKDGAYIILDVRRADEFAEGHIPGAINVANESIGTEAPAELPDKDQIIYVYCRSGNRSKQASEKLVGLGYTHIIEFGGILDWTGEIEK